MMPNVPKSAQREVWDAPVTSAALREIGLFGALSDEVIDHLTRTLQILRVDPGEVLFREGDTPAREMFVIVEGETEVTKRSRRGRDMRVAILGPGDWFGEMSLIDMQARSATVRTLAAARLLRITSEDLDALYRLELKSYSLILLNIARDLSRRLRVTDGIVAEFAPNVLEEYTAAKKA